MWTRKTRTFWLVGRKRHWRRIVKLEVKKEDCWIGCYWKKTGYWRYDVYICLLPCLPVHILLYS